MSRIDELIAELCPEGGVKELIAVATARTIKESGWRGAGSYPKNNNQA